MNNSVPTRRGFVKTFALGTAAYALFGKVWENSLLADVTPSTAGKLVIKVSDFPALGSVNGSIRLGVCPFDYDAIGRPNGTIGGFYPILINRSSSTQFYALSTDCPHAGYIVSPYDPSEAASTCPHEGSKFALDGSLISGPAASPLIRFPISFDGVDTLTIEVPELGYCVNSTLVQAASQPRLKLSFPTQFNVEYEVKFRQSFAQPWSVIPFALTLNGPTDQQSLVGDGNAASVFVPRTTATGFYVVSVKVFDQTEG
jgi:Rieske Fe-S protein